MAAGPSPQALVLLGSTLGLCVLVGVGESLGSLAGGLCTTRVPLTRHLMQQR